MFSKYYRQDYPGEFIVKDAVMQDGVFKEDREWIENSIPFDSEHYGKAVVIGNGRTRLKMNLKRIENHATGIKNAHHMTSYGCNALYRDMNPDILVVTNPELLDEAIEDGAPERMKVVTRAKYFAPRMDKDIHLLPYGVFANAGALATYMACFDGNEVVYLLGFDNQNGQQNNNVYAGTDYYSPLDDKPQSYKWEKAMYDIFELYPEVDFVKVGPGQVPDLWRACLNVRTLSIRDFVIETDL